MAIHRSSRAAAVIAALAASPSILCGCEVEDLPPIKEPLKLAGGKVVSVAELQHGQEKYTLYCRPCHGAAGDGRGPAGIGLRPPPRDFRDPVFKFAGVEAGSLPPDSELRRIVKRGLHGTAMWPWDITDAELELVLQYIKTFKPVPEEGSTEPTVSRWTEEEPAAPIEITEDPWKGKESEGVVRGRVVYHGLAQCLKCHPAYATKQEIWDAVKEITGEGSTSAFREDMYNPEAKLSEAFHVKLLPPDFTRHDVKAGTAPVDLFRTIASGIGGTAMPMWKGSIEDSDIWALAHYVNSLVKLKGTPEARTLRKSLLEQPEWTPPATEGGAAGEGAAPSD